MNNFLQRKKSILSKLDKSSKKKWDEKIISLCKKINSLENFYTTSSCSGRIVLMINQDKKEKGLFLKVYHEMISFNKLKKDLNEIVKKEKRINTLRVYPETFSQKMFTKGIKFKSEPCILHVACDSLDDAQSFLNKAKLAGWKRSGIIATRNRFVAELNSTEKLEFPIIEKNKILVDDKFLKIIVKESNKKLKKSWRKIGKLKEKI